VYYPALRNKMNVIGQSTRAFSVFALVLSCLCSWTISTARAAENRDCAKETIDWVARADVEHPSNLRAVECFPGHVHLKLDIVDSPSLDVDLAIPAGRSFRHIGLLGVSPMLEVPDYSAIPAPQREALELLCVWLEKHQTEVAHARVIPAPALQNVPTARDSRVGNLWSSTCWAVASVLLALVAIGATRRLRSTERGRRDSLIFGALFFASLLLRLSFGTFGPHHVNGQGPLWVLAANSDPSLLVGYGPGYHELFSWLGDVFPRQQDTAIFVANTVFSALAAPLLFALARLLSLDVRRASLAGAIIAVDSVSIRFSATEAYFPSIITLTLGAAILFVWSALRMQKGDRIRSFVLAMLGALLTVQAARIHPVAWGPLAIGPAYIMASQSHLSKWNPWRWRFGAAFAIVFLVLFSVILTSGRSILSVTWNVDRLWNAQSGFGTVSVAALEYVPHLVVFGVLLFLSVKPRWLLLPAIASCVALLATRNVYSQSAIWIATYDRLWLSAPLLALASMVPDVMFRSRRNRSLLGAAVVLFFVAGWSTIHDRTTEQREYSFFRNAFSSLPNGCRVIHVPRVEKQIVLLPEYAISSSTNDQRNVIGVSSPSEVRSLLRPGVCLRYARTSICSSAQGRPVCAAIENEMNLVPLLQQDFPAKPSHIMFTYDRDIVNVGLFDVVFGAN
jgi:hypothetical protein